MHIVLDMIGDEAFGEKRKAKKLNTRQAHVPCTAATPIFPFLLFCFLLHSPILPRSLGWYGIDCPQQPDQSFPGMEPMDGSHWEYTVTASFRAAAKCQPLASQSIDLELGDLHRHQRNAASRETAQTCNTYRQPVARRPCEHKCWCHALALQRLTEQVDDGAKHQLNFRDVLPSAAQLNSGLL